VPRRLLLASLTSFQIKEQCETCAQQGRVCVVHGGVCDSSQCTNCSRQHIACRFIGFPYQHTLAAIGRLYSGYPGLEWTPRDSYISVSDLKADNADDRALGRRTVAWLKGLTKVETIDRIPLAFEYDEALAAPSKGKKKAVDSDFESDADVGKASGSKAKRGASKKAGTTRVR
jgi:hypothetical protein